MRVHITFSTSGAAFWLCVGVLCVCVCMCVFWGLRWIVSVFLLNIFFPKRVANLFNQFKKRSLGYCLRFPDTVDSSYGNIVNNDIVDNAIVDNACYLLVTNH